MNPATPSGNLPELMLCPCCCTLEDILARACDLDAIAPQAGCLRCGFTFPVMPAEFADMTLEAMHRHDCHPAQDPKNYEAVAKVIIERLHELSLNQGTFLARMRTTDVHADPGNRPP